MNTFQKMKTAFIMSGVFSLAATALKCAAMFVEFDREIGFFSASAPMNTAADIVMLLSLVFFAAIVFPIKKRDVSQVINYSSSPFRFFSSTSGCLMLVYAYVKWNEYLTEKTSLSAANAKKVNFLLIIVLLSLVSAAALFVYAFGKNEKNSPKRAFLAASPAGVVLVRAIEIQFDGNIEMNDPVKISFQIASIALMLALVYTAKCEFDIHETSPRLRIFTLLASPVFVLSFALVTVICYYSKVNTVFSYLVDALLYISLCGFAVCSYTPCKQAKPICDAKWSAYDDEVASLNMKKDDSEDAEDGEDNEDAEDGESYTEEINASVSFDAESKNKMLSDDSSEINEQNTDTKED